MESTEPLAMDISAGAKAIGLGRTKFYELVNSGQVQTFKIGSRRLVTMRSLRSYLERLEQDGSGQ